MKKVLFIIAIGMSFLSCSSDYLDEEDLDFTEKEYFGTVILDSQYDVDEFGSELYTKINGSLYIRGSSNITDLSPLVSVSYVRDDLRIEVNEALINLDGLNNLKTVGYAVYIRNNYNLKSINGLENLESIGERVEIGYNSRLEEINSFNQITTLSKLIINDNYKLQSINGFANLTSVPYISLTNNTVLADLRFLQNISDDYTDFLRIESNSGLTHINSLAFVNEVGHLILHDLPNLQNIDGLENLTTIHGNLDFYKLTNLPDINTLSNVTRVSGCVYISRLDLITNLDGLSNLNYPPIIVSLIYNTALRDYCSLQSLFTTYGDEISFGVIGNYYNPTMDQIIASNCSI